MSSICCSCKIEMSQLYTVSIVVSPFTVVSMRFHDNHKFKKSDNITLEFEPDNQYYKNSIKVMVDGIHRAYVVKEQNQRIGYLMKRYSTFRVIWRKNYNSSTDLGFEYDWKLCKRCHDRWKRVR